MLATLLLFATEAGGEEPDQTLFYILGGLAAAWAVVLFAIGMTSPSFPSSAAVQRLVILISVLVVTGAMAGAVLSS